MNYYLTWPEFYAMVYGSSPRPRGSRRSRHSRTTGRSYSGSPGISQERSGYRGQSSRRVLNPAFRKFSLENPIFQHFLDDKIGDFERSAAITTGVSLATAPWLNSIRWSSPQGFIAAALTVGVIAAPMIAYSHTADLYADIASFAATGQIHGHHVVGHTHN